MRENDLDLDPYNPRETLDLDPTWFTRDCKEFDEKLPLIAQKIVLQQIPFQELEEDNYDRQILEDIMVIMQDTCEFTIEMTEDELEVAFNNVLVACYLVVLHSEGYVKKHKSGVYSLTKKGRKLEDNEIFKS